MQSGTVVNRHFWQAMVLPIDSSGRSGSTRALGDDSLRSNWTTHLQLYCIEISDLCTQFCKAIISTNNSKLSIFSNSFGGLELRSEQSFAIIRYFAFENAVFQPLSVTLVHFLSCRLVLIHIVVALHHSFSLVAKSELWLVWGAGRTARLNRLMVCSRTGA